MESSHSGRRPKNDKIYRDARRAAGLTVCADCNDSGYITEITGHRYPKIGSRMSHRRCLVCVLDEREQAARDKASKEQVAQDDKKVQDYE